MMSGGSCDRIAATFAIVTLLSSCVDLSPYSCTTDQDCIRGVTQGQCGPVGHCAYPDASCPSGLRYSDLAGIYANQCTEGGPATDGGSGTTTDVAVDTGSTGEPDIAPECGNEIVEPGEECDDGNDIDGDGCNADCTLSGRLRWSLSHAGAGAATDVARSVTTLAGGGLAVTGYVTGEDGQPWIWVARYDGEGHETWSLELGHEAARDEGFDLVQGGNANLYVAGLETPPREATRAWLGAITPDGMLAWTRNPEGNQARAVSTLGNHVLAVGVRGSRMFAEAYMQNGNESWRIETDTEGSPRPDAVHLVQADEAWITGRYAGDMGLGRVNPVGFELVVTHTGGVGASEWGQSVLTHDDLVIVAGFEIAQTSADAWVGAYTARGALVWEYRPEPAPFAVNEEAEAMALDPQGRLVIVGFGTRDHRDAWVATIDPQTGQEIWHRSYHDVIEQAHTARGVAVAPDGTIYIAGEIEGEDGSTDAWIAAVDP
jgi:cysteine-rich repeat protein